MNKKTKIISSITLLGVAIAAIVTPIVVITQKNKKNVKLANKELKTILKSLMNVKITIDKGIDTSTNDKLKIAIINALKKDNNIKLNDSQLDKIFQVIGNFQKNNSYNTLKLKINIAKADVSNVVEIQVKQEKTTQEKINTVKEFLETKNNDMLIIKHDDDGSVVSLKDLIIREIKTFFTHLNTHEGTTIDVKSSNDMIRKGGIGTKIDVTINLLDGQEKTVIFKVKRDDTDIKKANSEQNNIISALKGKTFSIAPNVDTSDNQKLKEAIIFVLKNNKIINLNDNQIAKITTVSGTIVDDKTNHKITLTIEVPKSTKPRTVDIWISQDISKAIEANKLLEKIKTGLKKLRGNKTLIISPDRDISNPSKLKKAIVENLQKHLSRADFDNLTDSELDMIDSALSVDIKDNNTPTDVTLTLNVLNTTKSGTDLQVIIQIKQDQTISEKADAEQQEIIDNLKNKSIILSDKIDTRKDPNALENVALKNAIIKYLKEDDNPKTLSDDQLDRIISIKGDFLDNNTEYTITLMIGIPYAKIIKGVEIKVKQPPIDTVDAHNKILRVKRFLETKNNDVITIKYDNDASITSLKDLIINKINTLFDSRNTDEGTKLEINDSATQVTKSKDGVSVTIYIKFYEGTTQTVQFMVNRVDTDVTKANKEQTLIVSKLANKNVVLDPNKDTSTQELLKQAIIAKLKLDNANINLSDDQLDKIIAIIPSGFKDDNQEHEIILIIRVLNATKDMEVKIKVKQDQTRAEKADDLLLKIKTGLKKLHGDKTLTILPNQDISNNSKLKIAILKQLKEYSQKSDFDNLTDSEIEMIDSITTSSGVKDDNQPTNVTLKLKIPNTTKLGSDLQVTIQVKQDKTSIEKVEAVEKFLKTKNDVDIIIQHDSDATITSLKTLIINKIKALMDSTIKYEGITLEILDSQEKIIEHSTKKVEVRIKHSTKLRNVDFKVKREDTDTKKANDRLLIIQKELKNKRIEIDDKIDTSDLKKLKLAIIDAFKKNYNGIKLNEDQLKTINVSKYVNLKLNHYTNVTLIINIPNSTLGNQVIIQVEKKPISFENDIKNLKKLRNDMKKWWISTMLWVIQQEDKPGTWETPDAHKLAKNDFEHLLERRNIKFSKYVRFEYPTTIDPNIYRPKTNIYITVDGKREAFEFTISWIHFRRGRSVY